MANIIITITVTPDTDVSVSKTQEQTQTPQLAEFLNTPLEPNIPTDEEIAAQLLRGKEPKKRTRTRYKYREGTSDVSVLKDLLEGSVGKRNMYVNDRVREALANVLGSITDQDDGGDE